MGETLPCELFREALEALDPEAVLLLDNNAADAMRETYADMLVAIDDFDTAMLKPGLVAHVQGRRVLALDGFEAALTDKAAKQRLRRPPRCSEPASTNDPERASRTRGTQIRRARALTSQRAAQTDRR